MKKQMKTQIARVLTLALALGLCQSASPVSAATVKLNKKSISVKVGKSATIKVKGTKKKAKWTVKSGKKYITLKVKKKASVKVYGVRKGTAKVQCKVGKKKLVCKVVVKAAQEPKVSEPPIQSQTPTIPTATAIPTLTPTLEPTPEPTQPYQAYEMAILQTSGPVAEYDCLKVETVLCRHYIYPFPGGSAIQYFHFFESDILRREIEKITITDTAIVPEGVLGSIDVSEKGNGSVMAWYVDEDEDGYYEMTIGQEGGVVANPNSSYLFMGLGDWLDENANAEMICGLENLDTSRVTDMSHMFMDCGEGTMDTLDFGKDFDVSNVTKMKGMFLNAGNELEFRCYTENERLYRWLHDNAEISCWRTYDNGCGRLDCESGVKAYIVLGSPNKETRPIHPPTEDRLMVEPAVVLTESGTVETYNVESIIKEPVHMYFFASDILREDIEFMTITDTAEIPENALGTMDVSEKQNGSVMAWYTDEDQDGDYEMTIGQEGGVIMNYDASYLFYGIGRKAPTDNPEGELFSGFDKLYPDDLAFNTNYMFAYCGDDSGSFKKLDLGAFSGSTFWSMDPSYMFLNCGNPATMYYMHSDYLYEMYMEFSHMFGDENRPKSRNLIAKY